MDGKGVLGFEYDLRDVDRAAFLNEVRETFDALASGSELGDMSNWKRGVAGTEKVFWRMSEERFFQEDDPTFIVVMQVPREVKEVKIAAAMQAYHSFNLWAADLSAVMGYLRERVATFFSKGAPIRDTKVWDLTPKLQDNRSM